MRGGARLRLVRQLGAVSERPTGVGMVPALHASYVMTCATSAHWPNQTLAQPDELAFTSFVVGGIGAATGITLLVLSGKHSSTEATAQVEPWIGYQSAGLSGTF